MSHLAAILAEKEREIQAMRLDGRAADGATESDRATRRARDVVGALRRRPGDALRLIAEVKLRSPSAGALSRALSPADRALAYAEAGATMVSVLCDARFFDGAWEHLRLARCALDASGTFGHVPLLAKEFVLDECQIHRARDYGADAVLLIARIVSPERLVELARAARDAQIEPLVEVVDEAELEAASGAEARVVGVNARDLDTLAMDAARTARVLRAIGPDVVAVHLSGLREPADIAAIAGGRPDAALVGEALMRDDDPRPRLRRLVGAAGARP
jgi:indole-3-glycerol phosphate synthase